MEGIFRLSGSAKRIKDLQALFNSPPKYGKGLDWTGYTVHDAANILRRYLNQLPEPIVPLTFYDRFRDPLRPHQNQAVGDTEAQGVDLSNFDHDAAVSTYQQLITQLPPLNRQLLLYLLDLLAVFSSKSDLNRMTAPNLAAIFQPGIISHPSHDMAPMEYRLSQDVLIYLIENQDNFLIGMGAPMDEKAVKDVERGASSHSPKRTVGRSASNASAAADSLRKYGVRRNVSVSSRQSKNSGGVPSPGTPTSGIPLATATASSGITRSNTLPSKKSPGLNSTRFRRDREQTTPTSAFGTPMQGVAIPVTDGAGSQTSSAAHSQHSAQQPVAGKVGASEAQTPTPTQTSAERAAVSSPPNSTSQQPIKERKISSLFARSPTMGPTQPPDPQRQPNRLKKKQRIPDSANDSAHNSDASLHGEAVTPAFQTPLMSPELTSQPRPDPLATSQPIVQNTAPTPVADSPPGDRYDVPAEAGSANNNLKPSRSPEPSIHSRSSFSDLDGVEDPTLRAEKASKRQHRWNRFSSSKRNGDSPLAPPPPIGQHATGRMSTSSLGSSNKPRKSFTGDSQRTQPLGADTSSTGYPSVMPYSSQESGDLLKEGGESEKKGFLGKLKARMGQSKEERREKELEKERAKSPLRSTGQPGASGNTLSAMAQEQLPHRGRSMDKPREEAMPKVNEDKAEQPPPTVPAAAPPQAQDTASGEKA